jgi:geranylgeranyl pyrophosphate synthase
MLLVNNSFELQELAWNFAKNLDISFKIWNEMIEYKDDQSLVTQPDTLMNAIYLDNYKYSSIQNLSKSESNLDQEITEQVKGEIINECRGLFEKHYQIAIDHLKLIQNENSQTDAITSLRSILNTMRNNIMNS